MVFESYYISVFKDCVVALLDVSLSFWGGLLEIWVFQFSQGWEILSFHMF